MAGFRIREASGRIQGGFRRDSSRFMKDSGRKQKFRKDSWRTNAITQEGFSEGSGVSHGGSRKHAGRIQGGFRKESGGFREES